MKRTIVSVVVAVLMVGFAFVAYASLEDDAKALAQGGAKFIKENGKDKGLAEIMNPTGKFKKGKLFLTANDFNGICQANAAFPNFVGQNHLGLKDPDGKYFIKEAIEISKTKGGGWLEWQFTDPETKKIGNRKGWVQRVEGMDMFIMAPIPLEK
jgi:cytochrome c